MPVVRGLFPVALLIAGLAFSRVARAQEVPFAVRSQLAVSTERLFGLTWTRFKSERSMAETTLSINRVAVTAPALFTTYSAPRLALDFFVAEGLSVGLAMSYFHSSNQPESDLSGNYNGILAAPRVGYAHAFDSVVALWPRVGFTYEHIWAAADSSRSGSTVDQLALTLECPLVITPLPHLAVLVAPTLDLGLTGSSSNGSRTTSGTTTELALHAGLMLYL